MHNSLPILRLRGGAPPPERQADAGATFMQLSRDGVTLSAEDMRAGFARLGVAVDGAELEFISR